MTKGNETFKKGDQVRRIIPDEGNPLAPPEIEYGFVMNSHGPGTYECHFWKAGREGQTLRMVEPEIVDEAELQPVQAFRKEVIQEAIARIPRKAKR